MANLSELADEDAETMLQRALATLMQQPPGEARPDEFTASLATTVGTDPPHDVAEVEAAGSDQQDTVAEEPKCPSGHALTVAPRLVDWICDVCTATHHRGDVSAACVACNYDECVSHRVDRKATLLRDDDNDDVTTFLESHEPRRVVLLRASILVDANRDGQFSAEDEGQITEQKPWRIWINDDNDWYETGGTDIPNGDPNSKDSQNHYIDQERDLVDFFPMTLQLEQALKLFPKETYAYTLTHDGQPSLNPACRIAWVSEQELTHSFGSCNKHIKDLTYARNVKNRNSQRIFSNGIRIPENMLTSLEQGKGIILVEGRAQTDKALQLKIRRKSDNQIVVTASLPLRVDHVESMYRTVNLMYATSEYDGTPRNRDSQGTFTRITEPSAYPDSETNGKYFVFLHGFNVSPEKSRGLNAEAF